MATDRDSPKPAASGVVTPSTLTLSPAVIGRTLAAPAGIHR